MMRLRFSPERARVFVILGKSCRLLPRPHMRRWDKERERKIDMAVKEVAKSLIDALPDQATMDDIMHALYIRTKFERGEREIRQGKGVSHEDAKRKLERWVK